MLNEADAKATILDMTGQNAAVLAAWDRTWRHYQALDNLELRYNYALIESIEIVLGGSWQNVDIVTAAGERASWSQAFTNMLKLCEHAQGYIEGAASRIAADGEFADPVAQEMDASTPLPTPAGFAPDPNNPRYWGDPLWAIRPPN